MTTSNQLGHLGILVEYSRASHPPFLESGFFKYLSQLGERAGIVVTVFSPESIDWLRRKVAGYRYDVRERCWKRGVYPLPLLLYDRIFYTGSQHISRVKPIIDRLERRGVRFLGRGLPGKWKVYTMLKDEEPIQPFLPDTSIYQPGLGWRLKLKQYGHLFLKPSSSSHGRGVISLRLEKDGIKAKGRTWKNSLFQRRFTSTSSCQWWLSQTIGQRQYIIQPFLNLMTEDQIPFDLRILLQKDEQGRWAETGRVIRIGQKGKLTSNLHGGGTAVEALPFLVRYYQVDQIAAINRQLTQLLSHLPYCLEKRHGPLFELGIDVGIEPTGKVWLLEVNSKPGRRSFQISRNYHALAKALSAPVKYASFVLESLKGV